MVGEGYLTTSNEDKTEFRFISLGQKGIILKKIVYGQVEGNVWNLGFGDDKEGQIDDKVISNNNDLRMVIQTVANTVHDFIGKYPDRKVLILPVDDKRGSLYNTIFQRRWPEIKQLFEAEGLDFEISQTEPYDPGKSYDGFLIWQKNPTFETQN